MLQEYILYGIAFYILFYFIYKYIKKTTEKPPFFWSLLKNNNIQFNEDSLRCWWIGKSNTLMLNCLPVELVVWLEFVIFATKLLTIQQDTFWWNISNSFLPFWNYSNFFHPSIFFHHKVDDYYNDFCYY